VQVEAKRGGFSRAVGFVIGTFAFAFVFLVGVLFGVAGMLATGTIEDVVLEQIYRDGDGNRIAIIRLTGVIDDERARFFRAAVNTVLDDGAARAVILRVDSPGGGVTASDHIWYQVERLRRASVPVVASYGGVAASGGYYVSCSSDYIMAETTSITGSIGVIAQVFTFEDLMDKVGVEPVTLVATGSPQKDVANDLFRSWGDADRAQIMTMLDAAYETFHQRVRDGRARVITEPARLDEVADGRVFTAQQALDLGLVDGIGYLDDAIAQAETIAGLRAGRSTVVSLLQPPRLLGDGLWMQARGLRSRATLDAEEIRGLVNDLGSPRVMYLMR
jgi:protease-4